MERGCAAISMLNKKTLQFLIFIIVLAALSPVVYGDESPSVSRTPEPDTGPMAYPIQFFRQIVSRADGHRCPMYPSCSEYSAQAFKKHGFIKGWVMTSDRLLRCGRDEKHVSENIMIDRQTYTFDPLQRNDFWWSRP
ncbi:MAG: membrane protein insertion efficiency factor YidD [Deltaproteobacteria bacterium]|nr:membrane protein insertion efficiency factor YidD [Deltaproteobacteria bacterium]